MRVSTAATGTRAEISLDTQVEYKLLSLSNPDRLVVDLPGAQLPRDFKLPAAAGLVKDVRAGHPEPGVTRIVFDLHAPVVALKPHFEAGPDGTRLVVEWPGDNGGDPIARIAAAASTPAAGAAASSPAPTPAAPQPTPQPADPALASAAATSRLIASTTRPSSPPPAAVTRQAAPPPSQAQAQVPQSQPQPAPTPTQAAPQASGTVATGVPTRIATGVPTPVNPPQVPADAPGVAPKPPTVRQGAGRTLVVAID
ncbi:MAG TPA: AMIN domain-containing protein, partial [Luteimonas sp.]|nr:AMIN domain-containing protein [Luteimonas sp.]